jgi:hypothetical protein
MTYSKSTYGFYRSREVPVKTALALADDAAPIPAGLVMDNIAALAGGADLPTTVTKVNALLTALKAAGFMVADE